MDLILLGLFYGGIFLLAIAGGAFDFEDKPAPMKLEK